MNIREYSWIFIHASLSLLWMDIIAQMPTITCSHESLAKCSTNFRASLIILQSSLILSSQDILGLAGAHRYSIMSGVQVGTLAKPRVLIPFDWFPLFPLNCQLENKQSPGNLYSHVSELYSYTENTTESTSAMYKVWSLPAFHITAIT